MNSLKEISKVCCPACNTGQLAAASSGDKVLTFVECICCKLVRLDPVCQPKNSFTNIMRSVPLLGNYEIAKSSERNTDL